MKTPVKDSSKILFSDNMVNRTPTRRSYVKPTSLFSDFEEIITDRISVSKSEAKTGGDLHHIKRIEKQNDLPVYETEIGDEVTSIATPKESKSDNLGMKTVHDVPNIANNGFFVSKEDDLPKGQQDLTTTAEYSDNYDMKVGANSELQDGLSNIDDPKPDEDGKLKAEFCHGGTDGGEIAEGILENRSTSNKEVESLQIIEETDEDTVKDTERAFLDPIAFACFDSYEQKATNASVAKPVLGSEAEKSETSNTEAENLENGPEFRGDFTADDTGISKIILEGGKACIREDIESGLDKQLFIADPEQPSRVEDVDLTQKDEGDEDQPDSVMDDLSEHGITAFKKNARLNEAEYDLAENAPNVDRYEKSALDESLQNDKDITTNDDECTVLVQESTEFSDTTQLPKVHEELLRSENEIIPCEIICQNVTHVDDCCAVVHDKENSSGVEFQASAAPDCRLTSEAVDKFIDNLKTRIPEVSLTESIAIYRKVTDAQKFIFNEIERKIEKGSSQ